MLAELFAQQPTLGLVVLAIAGVLAGIVNSMAGGGSFLTVPVLIALGIPGTSANGTIRMGILLHCLAGAVTFSRQGVRAPRTALRLIPALMVGAGIGSFAATRIDDALFRPLFGVVMLAYAVAIVVRRGGFPTEAREARELSALSWLLALAVGLYGGFLQAGVGLLILPLLVLHLRLDAVEANAAKMWIIFSYTLVALPMFASAGKIEWIPAAVLALSTSLGTAIGARWQVRAGAKVVKWFLFGAVLLGGASMFASALGL